MFLVEIWLLATFGLGMEVFFTAITGKPLHHIKRHLVGFSSIWYMPLYGLAPILMHLIKDQMPGFFEWFVLIRCVVYMLIIYFCEAVWMFTLHNLLGSSPSEDAYKKSGRSLLGGMIRWDFSLAWMFAGWVLETIHSALHQFGSWG